MTIAEANAPAQAPGEPLASGGAPASAGTGRTASVPRASIVPRTKTLLSVQYARGVAAVSVVMFHAFNDAGVTHYPEQVLQAGVDLFFAISGFIMWVTTFGTGIGPKAFMGKRIRRIVPLYWLLTGFTVLLAFVAPQLGKRTGALDAVASFLFMPAVNTATHQAQPVIAPGWTLNHEMLFYLIFALALMLPARRRLLAVVGANVALAAAGWLTHGPLFVSFYTNPIILEFVFGVCVGWLYTSGRRLPRRTSAVLAAGGALTMIGCAAAWGQNANLRVLLWGIPAAVIILALALTENYRPVAKMPRWLLLGDASYSIYLVHGIVLSALFALVRHVGAPNIVMIPLGIPAAIVLAIGVYRYVERPMTRYLQQRRRVAVAPAARFARPEVIGAVES